MLDASGKCGVFEGNIVVGLVAGCRWFRLGRCGFFLRSAGNEKQSGEEQEEIDVSARHGGKISSIFGSGNCLNPVECGT